MSKNDYLVFFYFYRAMPSKLSISFFSKIRVPRPIICLKVVGLFTSLSITISQHVLQSIPVVSSSLVVAITGQALRCKNTTFQVFCKGKAGKNLYIYDSEEIIIYDNPDNWDNFLPIHGNCDLCDRIKLGPA